MASNRLHPIVNEEQDKLSHEIAGMIMDFVCYGQKSYSKRLQKFIATGMHDVRAGLLVMHIMAKCQEYLDKENNK